MRITNWIVNIWWRWLSKFSISSWNLQTGWKIIILPIRSYCLSTRYELRPLIIATHTSLWANTSIYSSIYIYIHLHIHLYTPSYTSIYSFLTFIFYNDFYLCIDLCTHNAFTTYNEPYKQAPSSLPNTTTKHVSLPTPSNQPSLPWWSRQCIGNCIIPSLYQPFSRLVEV